MYGGVSLAIYMNGIAQEFMNLVLSTASSEDGTLLLNSPPQSGRKPDSAYLEGTRAVYRQMAEKIEGKNGLFPKFIVDILSGTSAGGLNGMFLAKALVEQKSFEPLRDLWINEGEIEMLLDRDQSYADLPSLSRRPSRSLLNSRRMYLKLLGALEEMDRKPLGLSTEGNPNGAVLVEELDLHMTATDLVGRPIPINLGAEEFIPRISDVGGDDPELRRFQLERENRAAFHFRFAPGESDPHDPKKGPRNDFKPFVNPFLAFVGRCTSSIVPAFEPMRLKDAIDVLDEIGHPLRNADWKQYYTQFWRGARFLSPSQTDTKQNVTKEAEASFKMRPFGDGGYLDNRPFGHAFTSLKQRKARRPVRRLVFYVEPHPERNVDALKSMEVPTDPLSAIKHGQLATSLGKAQNIHDRVREMRKLADQSERVRRATDLQDPNHNPLVPIDLYYESTLDQLASVLSDLLGFNDDSLIAALRSLIAVSLQISYWEVLEANNVANPREDFINHLPEFHKWVHENFDLAYYNRMFEFIRTGIEKELLENTSDSKALSLDSSSFGFGVKKIDNLYDEFWTGTTDSPSLKSEESTEAKTNSPGVPKRPEDAFARMASALDECRLKPETQDQVFGRISDLEQQVLDRLLKLRISVGEVCYVQVRTTDERSKSKTPESIRRACEVLIDGISGGDKDDNVVRRGRPSMIKTLMSSLRKVMALDEKQEAYKKWMTGPKITLEEFKRYDAAMFPLLYQAGMADSYALDLVRVSPVDARSLTMANPNPVAKLAGIGLGHFAAFLSRPGRIMDIVWGRLDAAEVILKTYLSKSEVEELLPKAQLAIIAEALESTFPEKDTTKNRSRLLEDQVENAIEQLEALARLVTSKAGYEK